VKSCKRARNEFTPPALGVAPVTEESTPAPSVAQSPSSTTRHAAIFVPSRFPDAKRMTSAVDPSLYRNRQAVGDLAARTERV